MILNFIFYQFQVYSMENYFLFNTVITEISNTLNSFSVYTLKLINSEKSSPTPWPGWSTLLGQWGLRQGVSGSPEHSSYRSRGPAGGEEADCWRAYPPGEQRRSVSNYNADPDSVELGEVVSALLPAPRWFPRCWDEGTWSPSPVYL